MINSVKTSFTWFCVSIFCIASIQANANTPAYIQQYKTIVLNEMSRVGIPASIKMAQAILESGSGKSTLAKQSNNHFGIKCGSSWTGEEVYRHDDDYKNGLLVRSCFRAYDDPALSFIAHSDFLTDNRRYGFLFDLDIYDYKAWANGLRQAGYATDPNYPKKLIDLIEKYDLHLLDTTAPTEEQDFFVVVDRPENNESEVIEVSDPPTHTIDEPNVIATNSSRGDRNRERTQSAFRDGYYIFKDGDTMKDVAASHRLALKELYFRNRLPYGSQPKAGEEIAINHYIHFKDIPDVRDDQESLLDHDFLFEEVITITSL